MTDDRQYFERDVMALDRDGGHYSRHLSAMTGEDLHDKSDIAAELAYRDAQIEKLQAQVDLRDSMMADKNRRYQTVRVDRNRVQRERDVAYSALKDIVSPIGRMERLAASEGSVLSSQAASIANDVSYLRSIATEVLEGHPNEIMRLLIAQIRSREINDIIDEIGSDLDAVHVVVMLRQRLAEVRNTPAFRDSSDLEIMLESVVREEREAVAKEIDLIMRLRTKNCKDITAKKLQHILKEVVPSAATGWSAPTES